MSILDRFARSVQNRAQTRGATIVGGVKSAAVGQVLGAATGIIGRATDYQQVLAEKALNAVNAGPVLRGLAEQLGLSNPAGNVNRPASTTPSDASRSLARQLSGRLGALGPPSPRPVSGTAAPSAGPPVGPVPTPTALPSNPGPSAWSPAPLWGMMDLNRYRQMWLESAQMQKAWKNLWFVIITDFGSTNSAPGDLTTDAINVLALDVSFAPHTIDSEPVPIGSAVMDSVTGKQRVELRLTTMDTARGDIKRWLEFKARGVAHTDGTFGLPRDYLLGVQLRHMDPAGEWEKQQRFRHRWVMRVASVECELSRRVAELEELQITLAEFDTFFRRDAA